jgi:hypothetical protein
VNTIDYEKVKQAILNFATQGIEQFLQKHPGCEFYAFAFDCNAEYAEINLCLNTEVNFEKTLEKYKAEYPESYRSAEDVRALKYNTGDWEYQCFDTMYVFNDEELNAIFQAMPEDDYQTWQNFVEHLLVIFTEALKIFTQSVAYQKITKTSDFIAFCVDHDEDFDTALNRMSKLGNETKG